MERHVAQPLLPRISMSWFFIVVTVIAIAFPLIRAADQGQALAAGLIMTGVFIVLFFVLSGICFLIAFLFGSTDRLLESQPQPESPFSDAGLPKQIVPPTSKEAT